MSWLPTADVNAPAEIHADTWTIQKVLTWSAGWLKDRGVDKDATNHRLEVELLLADILKCDRMKLYLQLDKPLSREERDDFKKTLRRRAEGEPISYLLGHRDFYRHRFIVSPAVLIPRADTEILVERSLEMLTSVQDPIILDVGTGSGCVGISIAKARTDARVTGWDISSEALAVASKNAEVLECENIRLEVRDAMSVAAAGPFDMIVSNPPYIARSELASLSVSVGNHEPHIALFDLDEDGLGFYRHLAAQSKLWLHPHGQIVVECGYTQAEQVAKIFADAGLEKLTITKDLAGHQRVVSAARNS